MSYLYSLYDALVSIAVPADKARAVIDAMERDMGTTLATKQDLELLRRDMENRFALVDQRFDGVVTQLSQRIDNVKTELELKIDAQEFRMTVKLGSMMVVGFGLCLLLALPAVARDWSPAEKAVWQLEEDYWRFVSAGDVDAYVKLWHDDFVGWPCFELNPARKGDIGKWVRDIRDNRWKLTYQLKPLDMQEFGGDTVVVHYAAEYVYDYGDGTKSGVGLWRKFTHTWMKVDDRWLIIGGMCAAQEPVKAPRG